jgi:hypothetical protein
MGRLVVIRHGEQLHDPGERAAFADDPTAFCVPCVTPADRKYVPRLIASPRTRA